MATLAVLKRTADFTEPEVKGWYAVLSGFPAVLINSAVIEVAITATRFPEVGDVYQLCRREAIRRGDLKLPYSPHGTDSDTSRPTRGEICDIAERIGLRV